MGNQTTETVLKIYATNDESPILVDQDDYEWLIEKKWWITPSGYARTYLGKDIKISKYVYKFMQQLIMGEPPKEKMMIDHIDGNKLNNCRKNLRWATYIQNNYNRRKNINSSNEYKNVSLDKRHGTYTVRVGGFITAEEAAQAADLILPLAHGEYAKLNFPKENK